MNKQERWLMKNDYVFTGHYSDAKDAKEKMKKIAVEFREKGYRAQVLKKTYLGRTYSVEGYSVYKKETKKTNEIQNTTSRKTL